MQKCPSIRGLLKTMTSSWTFGRQSIGTDFTERQLSKAYKKVKSNKGKDGIDGMQENELLLYLEAHRAS